MAITKPKARSQHPIETTTCCDDLGALLTYIDVRPNPFERLLNKILIQVLTSIHHALDRRVMTSPMKHC